MRPLESARSGDANSRTSSKKSSPIHIRMKGVLYHRSDTDDTSEIVARELSPIILKTAVEVRVQTQGTEKKGFSTAP